MKNFNITRMKKLQCSLQEGGVTSFCKSESVCLELGSKFLMQIMNKLESRIEYNSERCKCLWEEGREISLFGEQFTYRLCAQLALLQSSFCFLEVLNLYTAQDV